MKPPTYICKKIGGEQNLISKWKIEPETLEVHFYAKIYHFLNKIGDWEFFHLKIKFCSPPIFL